MDPKRVEVDLPVVVVNQYGSLVLDSHKALSDVLAQYFNHGDVLSVHIVVEGTDQQPRGFCDFIDPTSTYKSKCGQVLDPNGVCWLEDQHEQKRVKQLELAETE